MGNEPSRPPSASSAALNVIGTSTPEGNSGLNEKLKEPLNCGHVVSVEKRPSTSKVIRAIHKLGPTASLLSLNKPTTHECKATASAPGHNLVLDSHISYVVESHKAAALPNPSLLEIENLSGDEPRALTEAPLSKPATVVDSFCTPSSVTGDAKELAVTSSASLSSIDIPESFEIPSTSLPVGPAEVSIELDRVNLDVPFEADQNTDSITPILRNDDGHNHGNIKAPLIQASLEKSAQYTYEAKHIFTLANCSDISDTLNIEFSSITPEDVSQYHNISKTQEIFASCPSTTLTPAKGVVEAARPPHSDFIVSIDTIEPSFPSGIDGFSKEGPSVQPASPSFTITCIDKDQTCSSNDTLSRSPFNTSEAKPPSIANTNIPAANTYAEATNLAARFPDLASEILFLPLRPGADTQVPEDGLKESKVKVQKTLEKDKLFRSSSQGGRTRFKEKRQQARQSKGKGQQQSSSAKTPVTRTPMALGLATITDHRHTDDSPNWAAAPLPPAVARTPSLPTNLHSASGGNSTRNDHKHRRHGKRKESSRDMEEMHGSKNKQVKRDIAPTDVSRNHKVTPGHSLAAQKQLPRTAASLNPAPPQSVKPSIPSWAVESRTPIRGQSTTSDPRITITSTSEEAANQTSLVRSDTVILNELFSRAMSMRDNDRGPNMESPIVPGVRRKSTTSVEPEANRSQANIGRAAASEDRKVDASGYQFPASSFSFGTVTPPVKVQRGTIDESRPMIPLRRSPQESHGSVPEWRTKSLGLNRDGHTDRSQRIPIDLWKTQPAHSNQIEGTLREIQELMNNTNAPLNFQRSSGVPTKGRTAHQFTEHWTPNTSSVLAVERNTGENSSSFTFDHAIGTNMTALAGNISSLPRRPSLANAEMATSFLPALGGLQDYYGRLIYDGGMTREGFIEISRREDGSSRPTDNERSVISGPRNGGLTNRRKEEGDMLGRLH
ncbi:hypothetical protein SERLADRAFT_406686 [Serpula lacrymans var. lacrymans S7.9]|uniref:Uncharacterized protein n=1 Tax=Serpula lacrymans var. lacrymans (strain S7.9) TaxID=578457 RepID=F8NP97_SERL9|nr:uncharacterized protein SERLADRAFT_406686 [Serpula lacrymans var. lacrymans S7.9]EGO27662.1 hypothetical protein SERLADRAFT_406686 [Serpula lacrymans var. lacrymans S7.9]